MEWRDFDIRATFGAQNGAKTRLFLQRGRKPMRHLPSFLEDRTWNAAVSEAHQLAYRPRGPESTGYVGVAHGVNDLVNQLRGRTDDSASSGGTPTPETRPNVPIYPSRDQW
jgi:hypothetical protein